MRRCLNWVLISEHSRWRKQQGDVRWRVDQVGASSFRNRIVSTLLLKQKEQRQNLRRENRSSSFMTWGNYYQTFLFPLTHCLKCFLNSEILTLAEYEIRKDCLTRLTQTQHMKGSPYNQYCTNVLMEWDFNRALNNIFWSFTGWNSSVQRHANIGMYLIVLDKRSDL